MKLRIRLAALLLVLVMALMLLVGCELFPQETPPSSTTPPTVGGNTGTQAPSGGNTTGQDTPTVTPPTPGGDTGDGGNTGDTPIDPVLPDFTVDPYINVNKTEFYANYRPAVCYQDAKWRTEHFLMSGSIDAQDQAPTVASNRPMSGGLYVRNTAHQYAEDGKAYIVLDANGNEAFRVYYGGGYVTLEEVAAYVYAFGEIPANHISKKSGSPSSNPWGKFLRLNHSKFTGDTVKYPYEPELPDISGCGGGTVYYEMDIGTTGTDCDPSYTAKLYNNGSSITRGAARIVYTRYDKNGDHIIDPDERHVFYTYNHYNDFQEYLNYEGGWGKMFGNITGGGQISSKIDCNPTPYVQTSRRDFSLQAVAYVGLITLADCPSKQDVI